MKTLKTFNDVIYSRKKLRELNLSFIDNQFIYFLRRLKLIKNIGIGDLKKSWDIYKFLLFINDKVKKNHNILDIGCYQSEIILALCKSGYKKLTGIDLNSNVSYMPFQDKINYHVYDFLKGNKYKNFFSCITAVSVLEHGFDENKFLLSMSNMLKKSGYLLISFDYWQNKIDTSTTKLFNMDWNIFSKQEIQNFIVKAKKYGFVDISGNDYLCKEKAISHAGYSYTFGLIIFQKK